MQKYILKNARIVNEGRITDADILIQNGRIEKIAPILNIQGNFTEIDANANHLLPGVIDDQVHFREPGLTHKASIYTEARAGVAGGVTSYMEMPNTIPNALTQELLEQKYQIAANTSLANYSFFMGTSNDNAEEVLKTTQKRKEICGIKIFLGASTGNMLVNNYVTLNKIFSEVDMLIATHCEDERIIKQNKERLLQNGTIFGPEHHPIIRDENACFESSFSAIQLAKKYGTRLHILHISTEKELQLFTNLFPIEDKKITSEVCVHHLHFTSEDYQNLGYKIKCNPAIKNPQNRAALWDALLDDRLDIIATDHAPHLLNEKEPPYEHAHAGLPLLQHSLPLMLYYHKIGKISLEKIVEKMSHAVAKCFQIENRGFIREGYYADLVLVDLNKPYTVLKENILHKCGWSPFEGFSFPASITHTWINGHLVYSNGTFDESRNGMRLQFDR